MPGLANRTQESKLALLMQHGLRGGRMNLLSHYILFTLSQVKSQLKVWEQEARLCPNEELRKQALSSIHNKGFHCQGGAFFAVPYREKETLLLRLIIAYQTLCDYLDNLCDRTACSDGKAFRQLHRSLEDALSPVEASLLPDYYSYYPSQEDGGYIEKLVRVCQSCVKQLPSYPAVYPDLIHLVRLYIDLQVIKHIDPWQREEELREWAKKQLYAYPGLRWQEFAAAAGSTLAVFALFGLASIQDLPPVESRKVVENYFPWICGLHILLDYFIDQEEDREGGDLNFTFYYADNRECISRLEVFISQSHAQSARLNDCDFSRVVVEGLLAMYLSDQKIAQRQLQAAARQLLAASGPNALKTFQLCRLVRKIF
ncbi:tetraprenyl-beta-curcumene synthase family protein [Syntrophomonas wolfei]|uniref:DUF2600 domain-containing protein n=1 Tax=Syntrophomonas wolfei subsp. wolfei (strain DSM 2245B / Goettingen) TaxID=335541 RepID=Q0AYC0_SYNWW|nr:tetraprenyl-beta-curcumene synthase family protein [Syntrophomonas wolfei]ABI68284.1 conserved hypothetical protein [Syntrophomonas wolfei subsp. wolfei str. Goettingen G311]